MDLYKVVKIIDTNRIVINAGARNGIKAGDKFQIFIRGESIIDPDSKEELGTLDFIKAEIKAEIVYLNMCICINAKQVKIDTPLIKTISSLTAIEYEPAKLNVEESEISGWISKYDSKIKLGDLVRESLG